jgi:LPXTG-motif cell wall-anchored protein
VNCEPLPNTGLDANLGLFLLVAIGCLVLGMLALLASRRRRTRAAALVMILSMVGAAFAISPEPPATAETSNCETTETSLTVVQTSTMNGLAPGRAPVAITGRVVNNSTDSTYLTAVEVEITSVSTRPGSRPGPCDVSDFYLLNTRMLVERTLGPGGSSPFTGASIGFRNKSTNQDACQRAVIHLLYTANPD